MILNVPLLRATPLKKEKLGFEQLRKLLVQRAKKVESNSPGLVDFAIGLVNSVFNLPNGQVIYF